MSTQKPPKIWTEFEGRMYEGVMCTWQGLHATVTHRKDMHSRYTLHIQTERSAVLRRDRQNAEPVSYLVQNVSYETVEEAVHAADAMLDVLAPKDFKGCPTCGREPLCTSSKLRTC
jgi:hypothetical protein